MAAARATGSMMPDTAFVDCGRSRDADIPMPKSPGRIPADDRSARDRAMRMQYPPGWLLPCDPLPVGARGSQSDQAQPARRSGRPLPEALGNEAEPAQFEECRNKNRPYVGKYRQIMEIRGEFTMWRYRLRLRSCCHPSLVRTSAALSSPCSVPAALASEGSAARTAVSPAQGSISSSL